MTPTTPATALREAAVAVCRLWFTDNAPEGSQHVRKAMLDLRAALAAAEPAGLTAEDIEATVDGIVEQYGGALDALARHDAEPAGLDGPLLTAVLKFYADQMPAYAVAAGLTREEYAAVMVDVRKVRAEYACLAAEAD